MKMNRLLAALAVATCSTAVMADEEINYSFNLKNWNTTFRDATSTSNTSNASIVSFTAKKDVFYFTASAILPATFHFNNGTYLDRRDTDIAVGWMANSNLSLLGGVKRASLTNYDFSGSNTSSTPSTYYANYLGINGFKSIGEKQFLFGIATKSLNASRSRSGIKTTGLNYTTFELGIGHTLSKETQLTIGYRIQDLKFPDGGYAKMDGLIFGANFNF